MALFPPPDKEIHRKKLQPGVLGLGLLKKRNLLVGVFPEIQEILVCRLGFSRFPESRRARAIWTRAAGPIGSASRSPG